MNRYAWFGRFITAFILSLLVAVTGMAFLIADLQTCRTLSISSPAEEAMATLSLSAIPEWAEDIYTFLPAPMRAWLRIPEAVGIWIPKEQDRQEHLPRFE